MEAELQVIKGGRDTSARNDTQKADLKDKYN